MRNIDRNCVEDAELIIDRFLPRETIKFSVLSFFLNAIELANQLIPDNWNINLDKNEKLIRFNTGQEYCIEIYPNHIFVLAIKSLLKTSLLENNHYIVYRGYHQKKRICDTDFHKLPDCLVKIPDSIGCEVKNEDFEQAAPCLIEANQHFITTAMSHTKILPKMIQAHSPGVISYLSQYFNKPIPQPSYQTTNIFEEIEKCRLSFENLIDTERQAIIQSRIGQGKFRSDLVQYWGKCSVTKCQRIEILRASHIKPWNMASNQERLDKFNGLLLVPNLDAAFDAGLICFNDNGEILISKSLSSDDQDQLGIHPGLCINGITEQHKKYLKYHREYIYKGN